MGGFKKIGTGNTSTPTSTEQTNTSTGGFKRIEGWTGTKPATPATPAAPAKAETTPAAEEKRGKSFWQKLSDALSFGTNMATAADMQIYGTDALKAGGQRLQEQSEKAAGEAKNEMAYIGERAAVGAADATEGIVNAFGYLGQALSRTQNLQQSQDAAMWAAVTGSDSQKDLSVRLENDALQSAKNGLQDTVEFGERYRQDVENRYADDDITAGGRIAGDISEGVGGMMPSILANLIAPGSSLYIMAAGAGGNATQEALKEGKNDIQAVSYGVAVAAIEAATEKMFDGVAGIFGKGAADDVIESFAKKIAKSESAQKAILKLADGLGEGFEEFVSELGTRVANELTINTDDRTFLQTLKDGGRSFLMGAAISAIMQAGGSIANGMRVNPTLLARQVANTVQREIAEQRAQQPTAGVDLPATGTNDAGVSVDTAEGDILPTGETGQKNTASTREADYTIERDADGNTYIQINADLLRGIPESEWKTTVRNTIQKIFGQGLSLPRGTVFSNRKGRGEYTNGKYTRMLERTDPEMYADKLRMAAGSTGIVENARNIRYEDASHSRTDDIVGFNRGNITVSVKGNGYNGDVLTAIYSDGKEAFFDVNNLNRQKIVTAPPERYATQGGFTQTGDAVPDLTVPQAEQGVKGQSAQTGAELSAGKRDLLSDWELDRPVASKRDLLADWELQGTPAAQATEAETVGEEYWQSIMDEGTAPASETDTPGYFDALLEWVDRQRVPAEPKKATVATRPATAKKSLSQKADEAWSFFKRKMVDAGDTVTKIGKTIGDRYLYAYYNFARASSNAAEQMIAKGGAQTNVYGERVGQSLADLWEPIRAEGDEYYRQFEEYLLHRHNIDRMSRYDAAAVAQAESSRQAFIELYPWIALETEQRLRSMAELGPFQLEAQSYLTLIQEVNRLENTRNKPVFGWEVDADASRAEVARIEREHPEFKGLAEQVYRFNRNLMQYRVDSGLMTREQADKLEEIYPHYVPTYRQTENDVKTRRKKGVQIGKTVGRAEGGNANLMPLHLAMARQTMQVTREGAKNRFGARLLEDVLSNEASLKEYVKSAEEKEWEPHPDTFDALDDPTPQKTNTFTVFRDGRAWVMEVDEGLYEAVSALSPEGKEANVLTKAVRSANDLFKKLVTGYNPMFMARNVVRDLQDAGLYSKDLSAWTQNYPLAVKEIVTDGEYWRKYKALGGTYSSVFDYEQGYQTDESRSFLSRNVLDRIEALNMATEQAPRLAEFMATVKKGDGSMDNLMEAMHDAADITVNFGRGGTLGKNLNQNFVPFLNPGIQGFDKMVRRFTETKGAKEWSKLIVKCAALGIAPTLINAFLYQDDEEWEDLKDSDKDVNYLLKLGDGKWLKIPKGRTLSLMGMVADRVGDALQGEEVDLGGMVTTAANQIAPANPLENNIMAAWVDADLFDQSSPGKTWYGSDLEGQRLQNYEPGQRYDESTDVFSKWLGGVLNLSPKKINYLLDQYSGVVGDFVLPLLTPQAEQNPFAKSFVLDSVTSNKINGEFYDKSDEITFAKNGGDGAMALVSRFWNKQAGAVSDIYAQIREIENDTRLTDAEKKEQVREAKAILNGVQKNALEVLPKYETAVRKYYTGSSSEELDLAYRKANCEVFGAEYALKVYDKSVYEKAVSLEKKGIDYSDFYNAYFAQRDVTGDPDGKGGTVYLSASRNKKKAIDEATPWLNPWSRQILYEAFGVSEKVW